MDKNIIDKNKYADLFRRIGNLLNLTLFEIREEYMDYPHSLIDYYEKEFKEKAMEICFDEEEIMITCMFNTKGKCDRLFLYADKIGTIEEIISYLKATYNYNFIKNRWKMSDIYIKIVDANSVYNEVGFIFFI